MRPMGPNDMDRMADRLAMMGAFVILLWLVMLLCHLFGVVEA
jgi:hypothetical protein